MSWTCPNCNMTWLSGRVDCPHCGCEVLPQEGHRAATETRNRILPQGGSGTAPPKTVLPRGGSSSLPQPSRELQSFEHVTMLEQLREVVRVAFEAGFWEGAMLPDNFSCYDSSERRLKERWQEYLATRPDLQ